MIQYSLDGEPDEVVEFQTILLEKIRLYASKHIDTDMLDVDMDVITTADGIARHLVMSLTAELWTEKLPPTSYTTEQVVHCDHYATWWDHLISTIAAGRFSWLSRWLPAPKFEDRPKSVEVTVKMTPSYRYPKPGFKAAPGVSHYEIAVFRP